MTDDDENVNPMLGTNNMIAKKLADSYGAKVAEELTSLLSLPGVKQDLDAIRSKYGIKTNGALDDDFVAQYVVDAVYRHTENNPDAKSVHDEKLFNYYLNIVISELEPILAKYGIGDHWIWSFIAILANDKPNNDVLIRNLIKVSMDKKSKYLTIVISPFSRTKSDLDNVANEIYSAWDALRTKPAKWQPQLYTQRDADVVLYKSSHSYRETSRKFNLDIDYVKKIVSRQKIKANTLKNKDILAP